MDDCEKAIHRMYHYLDGEITVWRRWRISRHLGKCPPCAQGYDFEMELRQVIAVRCRDQVPPDLKRRIAEALGCDAPGVEARAVEARTGDEPAASDDPAGAPPA